MSTHVVGFVAPDERWEKMKRIWTACWSAKIEPPEEVKAFFEYRDPDPMGVEVEVPHEDWSDNHGSRGLVIAVKDIPEKVTHIRFYNSW